MILRFWFLILRLFWEMLVGYGVGGEVSGVSCSYCFLEFIVWYRLGIWVLGVSSGSRVEIVLFSFL